MSDDAEIMLPQNTDGQALANTMILRSLLFAFFDDDKRVLLRDSVLVQIRALQTESQAPEEAQALMNNLRRDAEKTIRFVFANHADRMRPKH